MNSPRSADERISTWAGGVGALLLLLLLLLVVVEVEEVVMLAGGGGRTQPFARHGSEPMSHELRRVGE
jgi:hypothetical protein